MMGQCVGYSASGIVNPRFDGGISILGLHRVAACLVVLSRVLLKGYQT